jgi:hypothetical protein
LRDWLNVCILMNRSKIGQRRAARLNIRVYCDPNGKPSVFDVEADPSTCTYTYIFSVPQGCPQKHPILLS